MTATILKVWKRATRNSGNPFQELTREEREAMAERLMAWAAMEQNLKAERA